MTPLPPSVPPSLHDPSPIRSDPSLRLRRCDDCCHIGSNRNEHEYRNIEKIRQAIYAWDPFHPFIGSAACGNIWMWQEGLELNPGLGLSDVGLDVVMREDYHGTIADWNAPHWVSAAAPSASSLEASKKRGCTVVALKPEEQESAAAKEGDDGGKARAASGGRLRRGYVMMMLVRPNVFFSRPRSTVCKRGQIQRLLGRSRC